MFGAAYDVTVSAVPLPAAAWLFGTALLGFVAFSARRTV
ncbi:MAG: VPLPA-CTERM sorting domain-containing protein [Candidatus Thiodiazotropha taylori]